MKEKIRAFFAMELPDLVKNKIEILKQNIQKQQKYYDKHSQQDFSNLDAQHSKIRFRWVKKEQLHLTLLFLGYLQPKQIKQVILKAKTVAACFSPFHLCFKTIEFFPSDQKPHILSLLPESEHILNRLALQLNKKISEYNDITLDKRPFRPHVTLARIKGVLPCLNLLKNTDMLHDSFTVTEFVLLQSNLHQQGSYYQLLSRFSLE